MATSVVTPDLSGVRPVDDAMRAAFVAENERLGAKGLRVMATGRKDFDPATFDPGADLLPLLDGMTLLALVGIVDPPRPAAKKSIAEAHSAGIQVRMITGDHAVTAEAIARELGIRGRAITGAEFRAMSDEQAVEEIDGIGVIARVTPEDKVHLVDILRKKGHIVAMTGDGVNDAPALKKADIGVAMGITGTEVSKEAAVMILTDDDFSTIVKAVHAGPRPVRQPQEVHPLPGRAPAGLHRHVPRLQHPQRPQRRPVRARPDAVHELHGPGLPGGRPGLRQARRGAHGAEAAALERAAAGPQAARLARGRGVRDGRRHAGRHHLGGEHLRRDRRANHGHDHVLGLERRVLVRDQGRAAIGVQPRHHGRPAVPVCDGGLDR